MGSKVTAGPQIMVGEISAGQRRHSYAFTLPRSMYKPAVAAVHPYMGDPALAVGGEKNQITGLQGALPNRPTGPVLGPRVAWQIQTIETINGHGQTAAVESTLRRFAAPTIRCADKSAGGAHDIFAQRVLRVHCGTIGSRLNDKEFTNIPLNFVFLTFSTSSVKV